MQSDLFGEKPKKQVTAEETSLLEYDKSILEERIQRLRYLTSLLPDEYISSGDPETVFIFGEAKLAFINGQFISTILLAQAYIERRLQTYYISLDLKKIASHGIKAMINHAKRNQTIHHFLLPKIDELRKIRNPFVHLKEFKHDYSLTQRILKNIKAGKSYRHFTEIIDNDAKDAITLMCAIFLTPLK